MKFKPTAVLIARRARPILASAIVAAGLLVLGGDISFAQRAISLTDDSWNADIVFEIGLNSSVTATQESGLTGSNPSGWTWAETGLQIGNSTVTAGLPQDHAFTSLYTSIATGGFSQFQLREYDEDNVALIQNLPDLPELATYTMTFAPSAQVAYNSLSVLDSSSGGGNSLSITIRFTDGTSATIPQDQNTTESTNWTSAGDRTPFGGLERVRSADTTFPSTDPSELDTNNGAIFHIHENAIDLSKVGLGLDQKAIRSVEFGFVNPPDGALRTTAIWAISGVKASTVFKWSGGGPGNYTENGLPTNVGTNWVGGLVPVSDASSVLQFETRVWFGGPGGNQFDPLGYNVNFTQNLTIAELVFKAPLLPFNITAAPNVTLTLGGTSALDGTAYQGIIYQQGANAPTISVPIALGGDTLVNNANAGGANQAIIINGPIATGGHVLQVGGTGIPGGNTSSGAGDVRINGALSGSGTLLKTGLGTLRLNNANAGYTGGTTVERGTLTVMDGAGLGSGALAVGNTFRAPNKPGIDVVLNLHSAQSVGSLSGAIAVPSSGTNTATINLNGAGTILTVRQTATSTYTGVLAGSGGLTLSSQSTGALTLTGSNNFTGATTVSGGTLVAGAAGALSSTSSIKLNTSGTLLLGGAVGDNRIGNGVGIEFAGGLLAVNGREEVGSGNSAGVGPLTLSADSTIDFSLGGGILQFGGIGSVLSGSRLMIVNWSGAAFTGGGSDQLRFSGEESAFASAFGQNQILFNGIQGYKTQQFSGYYEVSVIPEPTTVFTGLTLVGLLGWRERKRLHSLLLASR